LTLDVDPGSLIEKFARGARHVKRAARGDLHRFKAFIEMQERETGAWRGRIEDGELVEDHPEDYDQGRADSDVEEPQAADQQEEQEQEEREQEEETQEEERRPAQRPRRRPQSQSSDSGDKAGRSRARSGGGRRKRSTGPAR
jgi:cobalamin biosynthesis protein CobT